MPPFAPERIYTLIKIFIALPVVLLASCGVSQSAEAAQTGVVISVSVPEDEIVIVHRAAHRN